MKIVNAILLSIAIHGLIAAALIAYLEYAPHPDVLATLDLSSVELSFAETVEETAAAVQRMPTDSAEPKPAEKQTLNFKPETLNPRPPDPSAPKFPEPKEHSSIRAFEHSNISQPAPRQARLDAPPHPKRNIKPDYPKGARQRGEQGDVVLEIRVNAEGTVDDVKVAISSGFAELDEAAVKAARTAKFSPARSGRDPVASTARLRFSFKLK